MGRQTVPAITIRQLRVYQLFGLFNYVIDFDNPQADRDIRILYGENGSGKTTILHLIYRTLSTNKGEGDKGHLCKIPFKTLRLVLSNGYSIELEKLDGLLGSYIYHILHNDIRLNSYSLKSSPNFEILDSDNPLLDELVGQLDSIAPDVLFITDERKYYTTFEEISTVRRLHLPRSKRDRHKFGNTIYSVVYSDTASETEKDSSVAILARTIRDVFRTHLIERGNFGQNTANQIYLGVIEAISSDGSVTSSSESRVELLTRLRSLQTESEKGSQIGAFPRVPFSQFEAAVRNAPDDRVAAISQVLSPFLSGLEARLDATRLTIDRISSFIDEINRFYRYKQFSFSLSDGFVVRDLHHQTIPLDWLSSGERQLFTVLSTVLLAQENGGVVLVDEPELSLNVKWQREFVPALERINSARAVQYILATHSLEMLAGNEGAIVALESARREN
jgi:predicted ATPase